MAQVFSRIIVDGYRSGELDFDAALQRMPQTEQDRVHELVSNMVSAEVDPAAGMFVSIAVIGESDRYDVAGASIEERRAKELEASTGRMQSAARWLFDRFAQGVGAAGTAPPATFEDPSSVGFCFAVKGAADLVFPTPVSETQRAANRRVRLLVISFGPFATAFDMASEAEPYRRV